MPVGRRVHQADSEQPGGLGMEIRARSAYCGPHDVGGDAGRGLYSRSFSVQKKATEKTPVCAGYFSVTLKRKGTVLACRLSYLVVEKTTAFVSSWRSKGMCRCK